MTLTLSTDTVTFAPAACVMIPAWLFPVTTLSRTMPLIEPPLVPSAAMPN